MSPPSAAPALILTDAEIESAYADGQGCVEFARRIESQVLNRVGAAANAVSILCPCPTCCARRGDLANKLSEAIKGFELVERGCCPAGQCDCEDKPCFGDTIRGYIFRLTKGAVA